MSACPLPRQRQRTLLRWPLLIAVLLLASPIRAAETEAATPSASAAPHSWRELAVYPPRITLHHADAQQQVIAVATRDDGVTRDVTAEAQWAAGDSQFAQCELDQGTARVRPLADGATALRAAWGGLEATADVQVSGASQHPPVSFRHDVMPVFMRAGCNAGGCHGASLGKDGFRLSLFGFDPAGDYFRLTREQATRRIDLAVPGESLLLQKSTGGVPHTGGKRIEPGSPEYAAIHRWLAAGAPNDVSEAAKVQSLEVFPPRAALEGTGATQQFVAVAHYDNGTSRDVTPLVVFASNNAAAADIDADGLVTLASPGEAFVSARFDTHTVGSQVLALDAGAKYEPPADRSINYVDELVEAKLQTLRVSPSPLCSDLEFLRRVTLDLSGRLPTPAEFTAFTADEAPGKRSRKIDELLSSSQFDDLWAMKLGELLLVRTEPNRVEYKPMFLYWQWLQQQVVERVPLDRLVRNLLAASGGSFASPAVNFYQIEPMPQKIAENAAQALLGIRIQCAQCHNHPFDRWTMDDYYGFTAFFAQIGRKRGEDYRETVVFDRRGGEVNHPVTGQVMKPKFLGDLEPDVRGRDRRDVLAEWIVSSENPYFAVSMANRIWALLFGIGIVEPVDDIRVSNPPSNPALFEALGQRLVAYEFDVRRLVRDLCNSNAYQRSSQETPANAHDLRNFARARVRRIPAETLLDSIGQITEVPDKFPGLPLGARAVEIADGRVGNYFLQTFGRARRDTVCACEVQTEPTLSQALHLLNGASVLGKIQQSKQVERWLDEGKSPTEVIQEVYVRSLTRLPTDEELTDLLALCGDAPRPVAELQDIYWAVLNSREFLFNH
jgi:hypothetical protein